MRVSVHTDSTDTVGGTDAGGLRYFEELSGCHVLFETPTERPDLWRHYIDGALNVYQHYGVEVVLDFESIADGSSTAGFFAVLDPDDTMVAGMRVHGPHLTPDEIAGFQPWVGTPDEAGLRAELVERIPLGVVETKGAWSTRARPRPPGLGALLARAIPHAAWLLGVRYVFGASPLHCLDLYRDTGARQPAAAPVAYPDERYVTVPVWWDDADLATADPVQRALIDGEREQLVAARAARTATSERSSRT